MALPRPAAPPAAAATARRAPVASAASSSSRAAPVQRRQRRAGQRPASRFKGWRSSVLAAPARPPAPTIVTADSWAPRSGRVDGNRRWGRLCRRSPPPPPLTPLRCTPCPLQAASSTTWCSAAASWRSPTMRASCKRVRLRSGGRPRAATPHAACRGRPSCCGTHVRVLQPPSCPSELTSNSHHASLELQWRTWACP